LEAVCYWRGRRVRFRFRRRRGTGRLGIESDRFSLGFQIRHGAFFPFLAGQEVLAGRAHFARGHRIGIGFEGLVLGLVLRFLALIDLDELRVLLGRRRCGQVHHGQFDRLILELRFWDRREAIGEPSQREGDGQVNEKGSENGPENPLLIACSFHEIRLLVLDGNPPASLGGNSVAEKESS
jgi:hypothetical protein